MYRHEADWHPYYGRHLLHANGDSLLTCSREKRCRVVVWRVSIQRYLTDPIQIPQSCFGHRCHPVLGSYMCFVMDTYGSWHDNLWSAGGLCLSASNRRSEGYHAQTWCTHRFIHYYFPTFENINKPACVDYAVVHVASNRNLTYLCMPCSTTEPTDGRTCRSWRCKTSRFCLNLSRLKSHSSGKLLFYSYKYACK